MARAQQPMEVQRHLLALPGYEALMPVDHLAREAGIDPSNALKLDANENPFGTAGTVQRAIAEGNDWSTYPDPLQLDLRDALADYVGVTPDHIVAGAGSDELIELTMRALVGPRKRILSCPPTFGMYRFLSDVAAIPVDEVPRRPDFSVDVDGVLAAATDDTALVILASPNNPCGTPLHEAGLIRLLEAGLSVAVDEAYVEYAAASGGGSVVPLTAQYPRLIVFRTFSKWAALASLRSGFGVFPTDLAEALLRIKQPYNLNRAAEVATLAALDARDELQAQVAAVVAEREAMRRDLASLAWLLPYPSAANFLLCEVVQSAHPEPAPSPPDALLGGSEESLEGQERAGLGADLQAALARRGVFVRHFDRPRLRNCVRISVPRPDQHRALMSSLSEAGRELGLA